MRQMSHKPYPHLRYTARPILAIMTAKRIARFERRIDRSAGARACHLWLGGTNGNGYGLFQGSDDYQAFSLLAHRVAWALDGQLEPEPDEVIRHRCDCRLCCNGRHLISGTHQDNVNDMLLRGRHKAGKRGLSYREGPAQAWRMRYEMRMPLGEIADTLRCHRHTVARWLRMLDDVR